MTDSSQSELLITHEDSFNSNKSPVTSTSEHETSSEFSDTDKELATARALTVAAQAPEASLAEQPALPTNHEATPFTEYTALISQGNSVLTARYEELTDSEVRRAA